MAGAAEKKAKKAAQQASRFYLPILVVVLGFFVTYRVVYNYATFSFWHWVGLALALGLLYFSYSGLLVTAGQANSGSMYVDMFGVTCFVLAMATLTDWAWLGLLLIPVFIAITNWSMVSSLLSTFNPAPPEKTEEELEAERKKDEKRAAKRERKAQRVGGRTRVVRR